MEADRESRRCTISIQGYLVLKKRRESQHFTFRPQNLHLVGIESEGKDQSQLADVSVVVIIAQIDMQDITGLTFNYVSSLTSLKKAYPSFLFR